MEMEMADLNLRRELDEIFLRRVPRTDALYAEAYTDCQESNPKGPSKMTRAIQSAQDNTLAVEAAYEKHMQSTAVQG